MPTLTRHLPTAVPSDFGDVVSGLVAPAAAVAVAVSAALVIASVVRRAMRRSATKWPMLEGLSARIKWPLRLLLAAIGVWLAIHFTTDFEISEGLQQLILIIVIAVSGWLLIEATRAVQDGIVARFPTDVADNRQSRRIHTQVQILGRLAIAFIVSFAIAASLLTFPGMRAVGASILASAGLAAIIAGIAAQSALTNVFAGLQIAFSDSIRVDDVVIANDEYGRIEEITLSYVVVRTWDDRHVVLPSTYFTTTPFENWTRTEAELVGTVELDLDWTVPVEEMRRELERLLSETDLWDGRSSGIQVTEATGGLVRVRAVASAESAPILWDLRCYLREGLVAWVQKSGAGVPRTRLEGLTDPGAGRGPGIIPGRSQQ